MMLCEIRIEIGGHDARAPPEQSRYHQCECEGGSVAPMTTSHHFSAEPHDDGSVFGRFQYSTATMAYADIRR